jgi:hypothetical protein
LVTLWRIQEVGAKVFDFSGQQKKNNQVAGIFNFGGSPATQQVTPPQITQPQQQKGYTGAKGVAARTVDILLNRPRQALIAAATYDAKNNQGFLNDLKGGWGEVKAAMRGERRDATGSKYLEAKGMKEGLGRELAGGAIDILATPAFNPLMKAGGKVASPIKSATGKRIAGSAAGGAMFGTADAFAAEQPTGEIASRAITDAILFGGIDAGLMGLGKAGRALLSKPKAQAAEAAVIPAAEKEAAAPAFDFTGVKQPWQMTKAEYDNIVNTGDTFIRTVRTPEKDLQGRVSTPAGRHGIELGLSTDHTGVSGFRGNNPQRLHEWMTHEGWANENVALYRGKPTKKQVVLDREEIEFNPSEIIGVVPSDIFKEAQGDMHKAIVMQALRENKSVPMEVLKEYPELLTKLPRESIYNDTRSNLQTLFGAENLARNVKDISGFQGYARDVYRNLRDAFGKDFEAIEQTIIRPFDESKAVNTRYQEAVLQDLKQNIVDRLGIKKGSRDSALVQMYGEGGFEKIVSDPVTGAKKSTWVPFTWQDLVREVGEQRAQQIAEADAWFRSAYDRLIDDVNKSKEAIYPFAEDRMKSIAAKIEDLKTPGNYSRKVQQEKIEALEWELNAMRKNPRRRKEEDNLYMQKLVNKIEDIKADPVYTADGRRSMIEALEKEYEKALRGKRVPKRKDYYRHFREMSEGYEGLRNIFDSPANIDPALEGISHETLPRSKWASFAQKRTGGAAYDLDAVGGFLDYLPAASHAVHIDPHISRFQALADELADVTAKSKSANNLVRFLRQYSQSLAGKTNPMDRVVQEVIPGGRQAFAALTWLNNRVKANTVLGNASTAVAQLANIPQGIAFAKQHSYNGLKRTFQSILKPKGSPATNSAFLTERYGLKMYRQFDNTLLAKPKNAAIWVMETSDRIGTEFIWNACYEKALAERIADPIRFADVNTRRLVAGRGIGEVPLGQQSKLFQMVAPFQIEVGNLWHVMGDMVKQKDFTGLAVLSVALWMFNRTAEQVRGSGVTFDPLDALYDALTDEEMTPPQRVGRLAGEVLSNIPGGQTAAAITMDDYKREKFFGDEDPTRYGTGILVAKGAQNPLFRLVPPFGGAQLEKTYKGLKGIGQEGVYTPDGSKLKYPVNLDATNIIKGLMFGPSGFREARPYYEEGGSPLTEKQTQQVQQGGSGQYMQIVAGRSKRALNSQLAAIDRDDTLTPMEKAKRKAELRQKYREQQK